MVTGSSMNTYMKRNGGNASGSKVKSTIYVNNQLECKQNMGFQVERAPRPLPLFKAQSIDLNGDKLNDRFG